MLYSKISIGDKEILFCACASVNVCYFNIFHEDFIKTVTKDEDIATSAFMRMAFVMAKYAELNDRKAVNRLTEDDYCAWLDEFSTGDFVNALPDIQGLYMGATTGEVPAKKNSTEQNEK